MTPVKVNLFIVHTPADKPTADLLLEWFYAMRDEVNVWHYDPPKKPASLSLSWRLLLPWYRPVDPRVLYAETLQKRRESAHIYLFLTNDSAIKDPRFEEDVNLALGRRIDCEREELAPLILPIVLQASRWKQSSRLGQFEPLVEGIPLNKFPKPEEGFQRLTDQIAALIKIKQVRLNEARFYQYHPDKHQSSIQVAAKNSLPYLGENPEQFEFEPPAPFNPPDWLGWCLIALIFTLSVGSFRKNHPAVSELHLKARPDGERSMEYPRRVPMAPPPDSTKIVLPPVE